ncbi:MAG: hypothetical protein HQL46_16905 [Gammaproteobacteria bacterium]|nr:hypothetical protein [Gammaproteobacteria bacterium]
MFWNEKDKQADITQSDLVVDVSFKIECKQLPGDHIDFLYQALIYKFPWLTNDERISVQQLYLPASGNGWERGIHTTDNIIHLSKRTRLNIRLPKFLEHKIGELENTLLDINGYPLTIKQFKTYPIKTSDILVARFAYYCDTDNDEALFLQKAYQEITSRGIEVTKMLCGKAVPITINNKLITTRSLMIAELTKRQTIALQEKGIGDFYQLGCGLFVPQKGIKAVNTDE